MLRIEVSRPVRVLTKRRLLGVGKCHAHCYKLRICQNKTCKSQGSNEILKFVQDLNLEEVEGHGCGCLGNCGNGPNIVILPVEMCISHVGTISKMTDVLETQCHVHVDPSLIKTVQLRLAGNSAARSGNFNHAEEIYTEAIELHVEGTLHLLFANRSGVRLGKGDIEGALSDAYSSIHFAPLNYTTGHMRLIDVFYLKKNFGEASRILQELAIRNPEFKLTPEYATINKQLQRELGMSSQQ